MKKFFFAFLLLLALPVMASHIVGGEFELLHISSYTFRLNMILYFDKKNGSPYALDSNVTVSIYRKSDRHFMTNVFLPLVDSTEVGYTQPACSHGELQTAKLVYTTVLTLPPGTYNDPAGYYISWQRCCRNYTINNIFSGDPAEGKQAAGQTFYLEFPAVVRNGEPFYNSSPHLFPPLNDFACPGRPYYVDFAGVDDDNDSLVYTLVTPLSTTSAVSKPRPSPGPYPPVTWRPGFGLNNIMDGQPDLHISRDGLLTTTPGPTGLFVFAVKVEQYRNKEKIGESRRDFQMLVTDGCQPDEPPVIVGKRLTDPVFSNAKTLTLNFDNTVADDNRCIKVQVSDPDSQAPSHHMKENISIRIVPLNFKSGGLTGLLPAVTTGTLVNGSVQDFTICFPKCPFVPSGPYKIGVIAADDACSLPRTDTLTVIVSVQPPSNAIPQITIPTSLPVDSTLLEGDQATFPFKAVDSDLDTLVVSLVTDDFALANAGMTFTSVEQNGLITGQLHWDAFCNIYDFTKRTSFQVKVLVDDKDVCNADAPVAAVFNLTVKLPGFADPLITTTLAPATGLTRKVNESLSFDVNGTQADGDFITVHAVPNGFKLGDYQMIFPTASGNGAASSHFQWDIHCNNVNLTKRDSFDFHFVVLDSINKCRVHKLDTVEVSVKINPPDNTAPTLVMESLNNVPLVNQGISITLGQPILLNLRASDVDLPRDSLTLRLIDSTGNVEPKGYTFVKAKGVGGVQSPFVWNPDCSIFQNDVYANDYTFKFAVLDNACFNIKGDTVTVEVKIKDVAPAVGPFRPPNVITPNGDHWNDYFALEGLADDEEAVQEGKRDVTADAEISLPIDNCTGRFQFVRIFNRWGNPVFESADRKFRWNASTQEAGVYYYLVKFSNRDFKGYLAVRP